MAANLPPRSCSWQVISPCLVNVFTFQSSRGRQRNARTVLAHTVPYPQPLRAGRQQNVEAEARTCTLFITGSGAAKALWGDLKQKTGCSTLVFTQEYLTLQNR